MDHRYFVFDAYGTLFDVHSAVSKYKAEIGSGADRLSEIWRTKQLEYTWTRAGMTAYLDFWQLTEQALDFAFASVKNTNQSAKQALLDAYQELDCYGEVPSVLASLQKQGAKTAILSNGSPKMLANAISSSKLDGHLDEVFSVDSLKTFKTDPATYRMTTDHWGITPGEICFQSSNRWDIAGAKKFGFHCIWVNRSNQPDEYLDLAPDRVISNLTELLT